MTHVQLLTNLARVEAARHSPVHSQATRRRSRRLQLSITRPTRNTSPVRSGRAVQA